MLTVNEVWDDVKTIAGHCKEDKLFRFLTDAVEILAQKGDIDPLIGVLDICVDHNSCITLPAEVETPIAINVCGHPAHGQDFLFNFHLNGPGDNACPCRWSWKDEGNHPVYKDLRCASKLIAFLDDERDAGKLLRVFGFDQENRPLQTKVGDIVEAGLRVPMIFGYSLPAAQDPMVSRITGIVKDLTVGNVRLSSFDSSTSTGTLLGVYEGNETKPSYRRIKISPCASWVRMVYRKKNFELRSLNDRIYLHSRPALLCMLRSLKFLIDGDLANSMNYEANATRLITEKQWTLGTPVGSPLQVDDRNSISDKYDHID